MNTLVYLNFAYFLFLTILWYRKYGFNIGVYAACLYALTSFFSCLYITSVSGVSYQRYINLEPTIVYWILVTLVIWPFNRIRLGKKIVLGNAVNLFEKIGWAHIVLFFVVLGLLATDVVMILTSGDVASMRTKGSGMGLSQINSGIVRAFVISFSELSIMMIPFFMYGITHLKLSKTFKYGLLISSFSLLVLGMSYVDRSKVFFYIIIFGLSFVIFKSYFTKSQKKKLFIPAAIGLGLLLTYLLFVTNQRFGDGSYAEDSIISYAGQSFLNFCKFYESYTPLKENYHLFFPVTYYFFIDGYNGMVGVGEEVFWATGLFINVFYTFLGSVLVDSGKMGMVIFAIIIFLFEIIIIHTYRGRIIKFSTILLLYIVAIIPTTGIIAYYYSEPIKSIGLYLWLFLIFIMSKKIN